MGKSLGVAPSVWSEPAGLPVPAVEDAVAAVICNEPVNDEYYHLVLAASPVAARAQAGQFFHIACPQTAADKPFLRRPMSVYKADPRRSEIEFLYKVTGAGTRGLAALKPGKPLRLMGPLGIGFSLDPGWRHIVVLGRGVGLATLAPLAELAASRAIEVTAILSARSPAHVMSVGRFEAIGAQVETVVDDDGSSDPVNVERLVRGLVRAGRADAFFTCGSNRLMLLLQKLGREFGIPGQVALEQQMACGLGMCFCCVRSFRTEEGVEQRRVCIEGPVFKLDEAISW